MSSGKQTKQYNVIILAGGNSSRMNYPKPWLPFDEKRSILQHLIQSYKSAGCEQIVVVMNSVFMNYTRELIACTSEGILFVENEHPEKGRIYSLQLGIRKMNRSGLAFIHNVDNPYANPDTLKALMETTVQGYARPVINNRGGHPILVTNGVLENIVHADHSTILSDLLHEHTRHDVPVYDTGILCNLNTPDEYRSQFGMDIPPGESLYHGRVG